MKSTVDRLHAKFAGKRGWTSAAQSTGAGAGFGGLRSRSSTWAGTRGEPLGAGIALGWEDLRDLPAGCAVTGAVMLMETGGEVSFETRPVEGVSLSDATKQPDLLVLDGQQRLTSLTQAVGLSTPVDTRTAKGKDIKRYYYFDIRIALEGEDRLEDAVIAVDETRQKRSNFGRDLDLDLSTRQLECEQLYFPCNGLLTPNDWAGDLFKYNKDQIGVYFEFQERVISTFAAYQLPVIELKKETSKEAVCVVFEKVNTGGVQLSVFELITASYAAEGYNLRDDWFGSDLRDVPSRKARLETHELLGDVWRAPACSRPSRCCTRGRASSVVSRTARPANRCGR